MAKTANYLPRSDKAKLTWFQNFYLKLITFYVVTFGLTTEETDALLADLNAIVYTNKLCEALSKAALSCNGYRKSMNNGTNTVAIPAFPELVAPPLPPTPVQPGIFVRIRKMVKTLKAHPNYTEVIGLDLATIGATIVPNYAIMKPSLTIRLNGLAIFIKYLKKGTSGINLYCKRGAETEFTLLATITKASYSDVRANLIAGQPETRNYQAWYVLNDVVVGLISNVATFNVGA